MNNHKIDLIKSKIAVKNTEIDILNSKLLKEEFKREKFFKDEVNLEVKFCVDTEEALDNSDSMQELLPGAVIDLTEQPPIEMYLNRKGYIPKTIIAHPMNKEHLEEMGYTAMPSYDEKREYLEFVCLGISYEISSKENNGFISMSRIKDHETFFLSVEEIVSYMTNKYAGITVDKHGKGIRFEKYEPAPE